MSSKQKSFQDMRKTERYEVTDVVRVVDKTNGRDIGQLVNISEDGIMLHGIQQIAENSIMQLALVFDSESGSKPDIDIGVESLWSHSSADKSGYWTGFFIIDISDEDRARIANITS